MEYFDYTSEGYLKAKAWLESIDDYYYSDGWSVILYANDKHRRLINV